MLSKNQIKLITQLSQKKHRLSQQRFVAEGSKSINDFLNSSYKLHKLYTITNEFDVSDDVCTIITPNELKKISFLKTPQKALAIFEIKKAYPIDVSTLVLASDNIRDPGNLGTIIRLCDWFGIKDLVCNTETVDCYNPKVVQATMGSLSRVNITYTPLKLFLEECGTTTYGAFMNGENVYSESLKDSGVLVLGNEANGISGEITSLISDRISIPRFGDLQQTESLNVANAAAILLSEFKRRTIEK